MGRAFEFRKERKMKRWSSMSKVFSRIGKDISIAVKEGGSDPETNSKLRQVIQNAKAANMPKDNVVRAIKKASGEDAANYDEITLEGYADKGIAVFVDCTTDNNNRTVANVRSYFNKYEGRLGTNGSLDFIFERKGVFVLLLENIKISLEDLEIDLIDFGLEELVTEGDKVIVYCKISDFSNIQKSLERLNIEIYSSELQRVPNNTKRVAAEESVMVLKLLQALEDDDDVQQVFHNMEMTEEILNITEKQ